MAITRKTAAEFAGVIENAIKSRNNTYDTSVGPIRDLYIDPTSYALELQSTALYQVQQLLSLANASSFTTQDLDNFVYNESMVRLKGNKAKTVLTFSRFSNPDRDITIRAGFAVATVPDEQTGMTVTYIVDNDTTMYKDMLLTYQNGATNRLELKVSATASVGGTIGNVGAYKIVKPLRPMSSLFDSVYNEMPASGGTDLETNDELIRRYLISIVGSSPAVVGGIEKIIRSRHPDVVDLNIVYGNSPYNVRSAKDGGAVDVYTIGESRDPFVENVLYTGPSQVIKLSMQPVMSIVSITGVDVYQQGTDFSLVKDTGPYAGSNMAGDGVVFNPSSSNLPPLGGQIQVTYAYNGVPGMLSTEFSALDRQVPGRSLVFKEAEKINIGVSAIIKVRNGFNVQSMKTSVANAIVGYINALKLGNPLEASDLQGVARSFSGVDNFIITKMAPVDSSGTTDLEVKPNQYVRILAQDLVITD